jgi:hypothetical protein
MIHHVLFFGWIENSSCQAGEHCHRWFIKLLKHLTNNKEGWEKQLFNVHTREETLQSILASVSKFFLDCMCCVFVGQDVYALYINVYNTLNICVIVYTVYANVYNSNACIFVHNT